MKVFTTELQQPSLFYFGLNITSQFVEILNREMFDKVFFTTNKILLDLYGKEFIELLSAAGINVEVILIDDGEKNKCLLNLEGLCEKYIDADITKSSIIIAFGGGCLGNIVGMSASMIFRGIRYIEIPTTLLGITDSTLSNKQAVNGKKGKNLFGCYYAPLFIWADMKYVASENKNNIKAALVEGVKNAFISDSKLLEYFEEILTDENINSLSKLTEITEKIINSKLRILRRDPTEKKYAMILEYGHTFGHAIEYLTAGKVIHGLAVAKGMCIAAELSFSMGLIKEDEVKRHYYLLKEKLDLDVRIPDEISIDELYKTICNDNKKTIRGITYIVLKKIGECYYEDDSYEVKVPEQKVLEVLNEYKTL